MKRDRSCNSLAIYVFLFATLITSYPATAQDKGLCRVDFTFTVRKGSDEAGIRNYIMQNKIVKKFGCKNVTFNSTIFTQKNILSILSDQVPISLSCPVANDALFNEMNEILHELSDGATDSNDYVDPEGFAVVSPVSLSAALASCATKCYSVKCSRDGTYYCITAPRGDACKVENRC